MVMRRSCGFVVIAALVGVVSASRADNFGGFSGVDRPYLVNQDRVCTPLAVASGAATGAPKCNKSAADVIAKLSIKPPIVQSGAKASFAAQASGRTITVSQKTGGAVVAWDAPDPVVRIVDIYASQYDDRVAVAYVVRRLGKEVTDVVAFDLGAGSGATVSPGTGSGGSIIAPIVPPVDTTQLTQPDTAAQPTQPAPPADPKLSKAIADARAAAKPKAIAAWKAVLAIDASNSEALFRWAAAELAAKQPGEAMIAVHLLADSKRDDAIEWLVEARFDPAFASVRADPAFRTAVGLDRKPATPYERLMGFGGQWEQTGTSCDRPEVHFTATRDRTFKIRVKTVCEGSVYDTTFKGNWRIEADRVVLQLPNQGRQVTSADEAACKFEVSGDEDSLHCSLGRDIDFVVLPTRR